MRFIATGKSVRHPNGLLVWAVIGAGAVFLLTHHLRPRRLRDRQPRAGSLSVGRARHRARDLCARGRPVGVRRRAAGRLCQQGRAGDGGPYLLPAIAAVVLGGTSILGGRGNYLGTVAGVILITLLQSILSVMQIEEYGRHVIYGVVIITMLLVYGRGRRHGD
jgi:ribose transport system permease protein